MTLSARLPAHFQANAEPRFEELCLEMHTKKGGNHQVSTKNKSTDGRKQMFYFSFAFGIGWGSLRVMFECIDGASRQEFKLSHVRSTLPNAVFVLLVLI